MNSLKYTILFYFFTAVLFATATFFSLSHTHERSSDYGKCAVYQLSAYKDAEIKNFSPVQVDIVVIRPYETSAVHGNVVRCAINTRPEALFVPILIYFHHSSPNAPPRIS